MQCDVAIIGGGPAGSTLATYLKQYDPSLSVVILEREVFPRDHVGESQLPQLMEVLDEMRVWDKVEAAGFPVKVGGRYRWGSSDDIWPLDFVPAHLFENTPRPGKFEGQRAQTAFQVDRSIYDKILLDHAKENCVRVFEGVKVQAIRREGDQVLGFELSPANDAGAYALGGETEVTGRYYVDASGNTGMMRRAMGVEIDAPTTLRNIAIWDYWQNAEWAEHIGVGGTRILVMSIGWGWLWFIPLSPTRTSLGLVTPASYLKHSGKKPESLYMEAIAAEPTIAGLVKSGRRENILQTTRDWSFIAERLYGENWFLAGDSAGFADPILSGGLTLAQSGARKVAYTILALDKRELDPEWLKQEYDRGQRAQIGNHVHFADYWYSTNGHFTELKEFCAEIARDSGVDLEPEAAFRWMGSGGFASDSLGSAHAGQFRIGALKLHIQQMTGRMPRWEIESNNVFHLNLDGATKTFAASYHDGITERVECFRRGAQVLPRFEKFGAMLGALEHETMLPFVMERYMFEVKRMGGQGEFGYFFFGGLETLEAMIAEGWVKASFDPKVSQFRIVLLDEGFVYGWLEPGQGLRSVVPFAGNRIDVAWDVYAKACEARGVPVG
ncbi:MAG TPA: NAD(P)/FAD-dependent oxidoreductase [Fimbriimonadaceae bacterium]|nr:NAD(P)/FAD-dependent oxidoreductase [Fimbriimonadaceae bacterium]